MVFKKLLFSGKSQSSTYSVTSVSPQNAKPPPLSFSPRRKERDQSRLAVRKALDDAAELSKAGNNHESLIRYEFIREHLLQPQIDASNDNSIWALRQDGDVLFMMGRIHEKMDHLQDAADCYREAHDQYSLVLMPEESDSDEDEERDQAEGVVNNVCKFSKSDCEREYFQAAVKTVLALEAMACLSCKRDEIELGIELFDASTAFMESSRSQRFNKPRQLEQWKVIEDLMKINRKQVEKEVKSQVSQIESFFLRFLGLGDDTS